MHFDVSSFSGFDVSNSNDASAVMAVSVLAINIKACALIPFEPTTFKKFIQGASHGGKSFRWPRPIVALHTSRVDDVQVTVWIVFKFVAQLII